MNKMLIAFGAAALAVAIAPAAEAGFYPHIGGSTSLVQKAGWDGDDYSEYVAEEREERAEERYEAREEAREYGEDEDYRAMRREAEPRPRPAVRNVSTDDAEPKPAAQSSSTSKSAEETKESEPENAGSQKTIASVGPDGCKKYFASVGMTLSVPCE